MTMKESAKLIIASINPGRADISGIGDGTIKGAIKQQNERLDDLESSIITTTDKTLTGSKAGMVKVNGIYGKSEQGGEPTQDNQQEIKSVVVSGVKTSGRNLYNVADKTDAWSGITVDNDGWITVHYDNSEGTSRKYINLNVNPCDFLKPNKEYAIVTEVKTLTLTQIQVFSSDANNYIGQFNTTKYVMSPGLYIYTSTTREDFSDCETMLRTVVACDPGLSGTAVFRISVLEDTSVTEETFVYEPYTESVIELSEPITLHGIGDVMDELTPDEVVRKIDKNVFDGSEDEQWLTDASGSIGNRYYSQIKNTVLVSDKTNGVSSINSSFTIAYSGGTLKTPYVYVITKNRIYITLSGTETVEELKAYLTEKPMTLLATLATPVTEPLPTVDQIALRSLKSFDSVTYITVDSPVEPEVEVEYATNSTGVNILDALLKAERVERSFTDGCNEIVSGITSYGVTPESNSPADIVEAIGSVYNNGKKKHKFSVVSQNVDVSGNFTINIPEGCNKFILTGTWYHNVNAGQFVINSITDCDVTLFHQHGGADSGESGGGNSSYYCIRKNGATDAKSLTVNCTITAYRGAKYSLLCIVPE